MQPISTPSTAEQQQVLRDAAEAALRAPSIFNTQPWRWQITGPTLELWAERSRQLAATDAQGRMLMVSCGVALHHALVVLAAAGREVSVVRLPDAHLPDLLAQITLTGGHVDPNGAPRQAAAIANRHTDRRPFVDAPVSDAVIDRFRQLAEERGVYLAEVSADRFIRFAITAARAGELDHDDPAYQAELAEWTHRPTEARDGVTRDNTVPDDVQRRIPLRAFYPDGGDHLLPGPGHDGGARYLVLWTIADDPEAWLASGEAMSGILLEATADGLGVSPMTDVVEVPASRALMHWLLNDLGEAQISLRVGIPAAPDAVPATPRRTTDDVIVDDTGV